MATIKMKLLPLGAQFKHDLNGDVLCRVTSKNPFQFGAVDSSGNIQPGYIFTPDENELNLEVFQQGTVSKTFSSFGEMAKITSGRKLYIKIAGPGWFVHVSKKDLKSTAGSMKKNERAFRGHVGFSNNNTVQITLI